MVLSGACWIPPAPRTCCAREWATPPSWPTTISSRSASRLLLHGGFYPWRQPRFDRSHRRPDGRGYTGLADEGRNDAEEDGPSPTEQNGHRIHHGGQQQRQPVMHFKADDTSSSRCCSRTCSRLSRTSFSAAKTGRPHGRPFRSVKASFQSLNSTRLSNTILPFDIFHHVVAVQAHPHSDRSCTSPSAPAIIFYGQDCLPYLLTDRHSSRC